MLTAVQFCKVPDSLSLPLKECFMFVSSYELPEAVIPLSQKKNGKKPFCNLRIIIFLIAHLYSTWGTLNP